MKDSIHFIVKCFICLVLPLCHFANCQCLTHEDSDISNADDIDLSAVQDFNLDLFKKLIPQHPQNNLVFSPYSVWNALVLAYFGSGGETESQLRSVLRVEDKLSTLRKWRQLEYIYNMRTDTSVNNTFVLSNRVYFDINVRLRMCMQDLLHNEALQLNIINDPRGSAEVINHFASETTRGHINHLVNPQDIMHSYMVLVNAAYFKGSWVSPFNSSETHKAPFETFDQRMTEVDMMSRFGNFRYQYDEVHDFQIVELPFLGDVVSMYLFLPANPGREAFDTMILGLNSQHLETVFASMFETNFRLEMPKFSLETLVQEELMDALRMMGIQNAFSMRSANFMDFSFQRNLYIENGIHKAFISVDEQGAEAGAATAFIANKIGGSSVLTFNRPFVFAIRDKEMNNFMFMGVYANPPEPATNQNEEFGLGGNGVKGT